MVFKFLHMVRDSSSVGPAVPAAALWEIRPAYWISGIRYSDDMKEMFVRTNVWFQAVA